MFVSCVGQVCKDSRLLFNPFFTLSNKHTNQLEPAVGECHVIQYHVLIQSVDSSAHISNISLIATALTT